MIGSLDISRLAAGLAASGALPDASAQRLATHRTRRPQWFDRADPAPAPAFESSAAPARAAAASSSSSGASKHANASCRSARALARRVEFCCCGAVGAGGPVVFRADKKSGKPKGFGDLEEWPLLPPIEDRLGLSAAKFLSPILPGFDDEELETLPACKRCNGTGIVTCGVCKGVGDMRPFSRKPCLSCNGEKTTHCYECYGTGKYSVEKPSGVFTPMTDEAALRLARSGSSPAAAAAVESPRIGGLLRTARGSPLRVKFSSGAPLSDEEEAGGGRENGARSP